VDIEQATLVVAAALTAAATAEMQGRAPEAVRSLHEVAARLIENDQVGRAAMEKLRTPGTDPQVVGRWRDWLKIRLGALRDTDLRTLLVHAQAVLASADPRGTADGRYLVPADEPPTRVRLAVGASGMREPADDPIRLLARSDSEPGPTGRAEPAEAIRSGERTVAKLERMLGSEHPDTLDARADLAVAYASAGRAEEAVGLLRQVVADRERLLGLNHPDTRTARAYLALAQASRRGRRARGGEAG
jgi:hypothetical protein